VTELVELQEQTFFAEIKVLHTLLSFERIAFTRRVWKYNFLINSLKEGILNCKGGILIIISKLSLGIFNITGNCKIQFPQTKGGCTFFWKVEKSPK
jgi:hypothetical protein